MKSLIETSALLGNRIQNNTLDIDKYPRLTNDDATGKTKEFYKAKSAELEKLKRESPSPKELEKAETKFRKAQVFQSSSKNISNIPCLGFLTPSLFSIRKITKRCVTSMHA